MTSLQNEVLRWKKLFQSPQLAFPVSSRTESRAPADIVQRILDVAGQHISANITIPFTARIAQFTSETTTALSALSCRLDTLHRSVTVTLPERLRMHQGRLLVCLHEHLAQMSVRLMKLGLRCRRMTQSVEEAAAKYRVRIRIAEAETVANHRVFDMFPALGYHMQNLRQSLDQTDTRGRRTGGGSVPGKPPGF